jgi:hypothetical protein
MSSQPQDNAGEFDDAIGVNDVDPSTGLSRRSMLKRGAVVGVAAAWSVPLVSAISMTSAHADSASSPGLPPGGGGGQTIPSTPTPAPTTSSSSAPTTATTTPSSGTHATTDANSADSGALAFTGVDMPIGPTIAAGAAAIAVGAGILAASRATKSEDGSPRRAH